VALMGRVDDKAAFAALCLCEDWDVRCGLHKT